MDGSGISKIYIFLSEKETLIKNDVDKLLSKNIFTKEDITTGDSMLICISRDYYSTPNETVAIRIRDPISNVFCPKWRINHVKYHALLPIMTYEAKDLPEFYIITENEDIYNNMDYFLHLGKFGGRYRMLLKTESDDGSTAEGPSFEPIVSEIRREDIQEQGYLTSKILEMAGYGSESEGLDGSDDSVKTSSIPGWTMQCASDWMTRLLDLFDVYPKINEYIELPDPYPKNRKQLEKMLLNPILKLEHRVGEDIRFCIIEDQVVRKTIYDLTNKMLDMTSD